MLETGIPIPPSSPLGKGGAEELEFFLDFYPLYQRGWTQRNRGDKVQRMVRATA
jgi:hypothetical protein